MRRRKPEPNRSSIVEDIEGIAIDAESLRKPIDDLGEVVECILENATFRRLGLAEARQIRSNHAITIGEQWNEIAKHVAR